MRSTIFNVALFAAGGLACPAADPQEYHGWHHHHPSGPDWSTITLTSSAAAAASSPAIAATSAIIPSSSAVIIPVSSASTPPVQAPSTWSRYSLSSASSTVPTSTPTSTPAVSTPATSSSTPAFSSAPSSASTSAAPTGTGTYINMCETPNAVLPSMPTPTDDTESDWWVYYHNIHRRNHSSPDASWSAKLADDAQVIVAQHNGVCAGVHVMNVNGDSYGQNIAYSQFWSPGTGPTTVTNAAAANGSTGMWYSEADNWTAAQYGPGFAENHFTQLIWKTSTSIGCATQQCGSQSASQYSYGYWTVCNYQATGNFNDDTSMISMGLCQPALPGT